MIYVLFDKGKGISFIEKILGTESVKEIRSPQCRHKLKSWLLGVFKVLYVSNRNDTIICWYDFQAVLCFWGCKLLFLKRRIVCLNVLLKDKLTMKNRLVSKLYRKALLSNHFKASVSSELYGKWLNKKMGVNVQYTLVHDVYHDSYECKNKTVLGNRNTVFCGGRNGRDWDFMIRVAESMPHVQFDMIMPKDAYVKYKQRFTPNINAKCNVAYGEFMETLCTSSLVCLPLDTEAPAGLIVMFQAAANEKMVITTDTVTTKEYISENRGALLPNDVHQWGNAIKYYLENSEERKGCAEKLKSFLKTECSEQIFVDNIKKMIQC